MKLKFEENLDVRLMLILANECFDEFMTFTENLLT